MTTADYTLSTANGATDEARAMVLNLTGTPGAARNVICPAVSKLYVVFNNTTGGFAQTLKTSAGTGISVPNGKTAFLRCDGTNVVEAVNYATSLSLGTALPATSGGTGLTSYTSGGVVYASSTSALATGSGLTYNGTNFAVTTGSLTSGGSTFAGSLNAIGGGSGATIAITPNTVSGANGVVYNTSFVSGGAGPHIFQVGGAEYMRLDSSGNLGLGVTPGTWASGAKALQIDSYSALFESVVGRTSLAFNARESASGSYNYLQTEAASVYQQVSGKHEWFTAPSGTAGNVISFTQAMTLINDGKLGIGTSTPNYRLDIVGPANTPHISSYDGNVQSVAAYPDGSGASARNYTGTLSNHDNVFITNNVQRARITSGGDLLVGTTTSFPGVTGGNINGAMIESSGTGFFSRSGGFDALFVNRGNDGTVVTISRAAFAVGSISVAGSSTAYNTSSDYRLKDNQQPLTGSGAFIDALQPKTWNWKANGRRGVGFIAHEAQAVSPTSVLGEKDAVDAEGKPVMQAMEYGSAEFIANIVAEIQSLRARVAALEQA
jgi:hypothetical protein